MHGTDGGKQSLVQLYACLYPDKPASVDAMHGMTACCNGKTTVQVANASSSGALGFGFRVSVRVVGSVAES